MPLATIPAGLHITCQQQFRKCGKCKTCRTANGHGPYWYAYWREGKHVRSAYIGKELPATLITRLERQEAFGSQHRTDLVSRPCHAALVAKTHRRKGTTHNEL